MRWPPGDWGFAANGAITVLATLAIGSVGYAGMVRALPPIAVAFPAARPPPPPRPSISPLPATPAPKPTPAPPPSSSFLALVDLDITDFSTGWLLLSNCTSVTSGSCEYSVAGTLDGGATWTAPVQVGPAFDRSDGGGPRTVRFVNHHDGFVYGSSGAYVTHDGGATWSGAGLPGKFIGGMAAAGQTAWAVSSPCGNGVACQLEIRRSTDGGRAWQAPHTLPLGLHPGALGPFPPPVLMSSRPLWALQVTPARGP